MEKYISVSLNSKLKKVEVTMLISDKWNLMAKKKNILKGQFIRKTLEL